MDQYEQDLEGNLQRLLTRRKSPLRESRTMGSVGAKASNGLATRHLYKTVGVDGPTASSARIGAVSNQDRSRP
jgi:hypothetical protein